MLKKGFRKCTVTYKYLSTVHCTVYSMYAGPLYLPKEGYWRINPTETWGLPFIFLKYGLINTR